MHRKRLRNNNCANTLHSDISGKDKDYEVYKETLNAETNEVRKSKRNFEHKLAQNIKSDSKSFYAYASCNK